MEFTGERFIPGTRGEIWVEHWHRYHFATRFASGQRVLDVACGEGYGTALLARHAARVTGADLAPAAIEHARRSYAGLANVEFVVAPCTRLPLADAAVDVVVSFETLEHIDNQEEFLAEVARVLAPDGVVVLSCPNKREYSDRRAFANEFHVKELYRNELAALVARQFPAVAWYGQRPSFFSVIAPEPGPAGAGDLLEVSEANPAEAASALAQPLYFLLVAGRSRAAVDRLPAALSVLSDRDEWVHRDYEKVMRDLGGAAAERDQAQRLLAQRDGAIAAMEKDIAELERIAAGRAAALAAREREVTRRGGLRWWLTLPLYRLRILKRPPDA